MYRMFPPLGEVPIRKVTLTVEVSGSVLKN